LSKGIQTNIHYWRQNFKIKSYQSIVLNDLVIYKIDEKIHTNLTVNFGSNNLNNEVYMTKTAQRNSDFKNDVAKELSEKLNCEQINNARFHKFLSTLISFPCPEYSERQEQEERQIARLINFSEYFSTETVTYWLTFAYFDEDMALNLLFKVVRKKDRKVYMAFARYKNDEWDVFKVKKN